VVSLRGVVASGLGQGAQFMAIPWVRDGIRRLIGFDAYPGTLNVRLVDPDALVAWRRIREGTCRQTGPWSFGSRFSRAWTPT